MFRDFDLIDSKELENVLQKALKQTNVLHYVQNKQDFNQLSIHQLKSIMFEMMRSKIKLPSSISYPNKNDLDSWRNVIRDILHITSGDVVTPRLLQGVSQGKIDTTRHVANILQNSGVILSEADIETWLLTLVNDLDAGSEQAFIDSLTETMNKNNLVQTQMEQIAQKWREQMLPESFQRTGQMKQVLTNIQKTGEINAEAIQFLNDYVQKIQPKTSAELIHKSIMHVFEETRAAAQNRSGDYIPEKTLSDYGHDILSDAPVSKPLISIDLEAKLRSINLLIVGLTLEQKKMKGDETKETQEARDLRQCVDFPLDNPADVYDKEQNKHRTPLCFVHFKMTDNSTFINQQQSDWEQKIAKMPPEEIVKKVSFKEEPTIGRISTEDIFESKPRKHVTPTLSKTIKTRVKPIEEEEWPTIGEISMEDIFESKPRKQVTPTLSKTIKTRVKPIEEKEWPTIGEISMEDIEQNDIFESKPRKHVTPTLSKTIKTRVKPIEEEEWPTIGEISMEDIFESKPRKQVTPTLSKTIKTRVKPIEEKEWPTIGEISMEDIEQNDIFESKPRKQVTPTLSKTIKTRVKPIEEKEWPTIMQPTMLEEITRQVEPTLPKRIGTRQKKEMEELARDAKLHGERMDTIAHVTTSRKGITKKEDRMDIIAQETTPTKEITTEDIFESETIQKKKTRTQKQMDELLREAYTIAQRTEMEKKRRMKGGDTFLQQAKEFLAQPLEEKHERFCTSHLRIYSLVFSDDVSKSYCVDIESMMAYVLLHTRKRLMDIETTTGIKREAPHFPTLFTTLLKKSTFEEHSAEQWGYIITQFREQSVGDDLPCTKASGVFLDYIEDNIDDGIEIRIPHPGLALADSRQHIKNEILTRADIHRFQLWRRSFWCLENIQVTPEELQALQFVDAYMETVEMKAEKSYWSGFTYMEFYGKRLLDQFPMRTQFYNFIDTFKNSALSLLYHFAMAYLLRLVICLIVSLIGVYMLGISDMPSIFPNIIQKMCQELFQKTFDFLKFIFYRQTSSFISTFISGFVVGVTKLFEMLHIPSYITGFILKAVSTITQLFVLIAGSRNVEFIWQLISRGSFLWSTGGAFLTTLAVGGGVIPLVVAAGTFVYACINTFQFLLTSIQSSGLLSNLGLSIGLKNFMSEDGDIKLLSVLATKLTLTNFCETNVKIKNEKASTIQKFVSKVIDGASNTLCRAFLPILTLFVDNPVVIDFIVQFLFALYSFIYEPYRGGSKVDLTGFVTNFCCPRKPKTETQTDKPKTQTDETETQTDETETQQDETETQQDETETQQDETETQQDETETQQDETETQQDETQQDETQPDIPKREETETLNIPFEIEKQQETFEYLKNLIPDAQSGFFEKSNERFWNYEKGVKDILIKMFQNKFNTKDFVSLYKNKYRLMYEDEEASLAEILNRLFTYKHNPWTKDMLEILGLPTDLNLSNLSVKERIALILSTPLVK